MSGRTLASLEAAVEMAQTGKKVAYFVTSLPRVKYCRNLILEHITLKRSGLVVSHDSIWFPGGGSIQFLLPVGEQVKSLERAFEVKRDPEMTLRQKIQLSQLLE